MIRQKKISILLTFCLCVFSLFFFPSSTFAAMYTYTGSSTLIDDGNGSYRIKFLTSGTFTPADNVVIDAFLVGGGGSGRRWSNGSGGGGGGYTKTVQNISVVSGTAYSITIGAGGNGGNGGTTTAFSNSSTGGVGGGTSNNGGNGGSGGGAHVHKGGVDGNNGDDWPGSASGGTGQGSTTREFGELSGTLYSTGGDGNPGGCNYVSGAANTGNGGMGAWWECNLYGYGGSGIVVIRFNIDSTPPTCGSWSPGTSPWKSSGSQEFTLSGSTDSGGSNINVSSGSCTTSENNGSTCTVEISDNAGNTTTCTSPVNQVDSTPPTCGSWSPGTSPWKSSGSQEFTLSGSTDSGGSNINVSGGSCTTGSSNGNTCNVVISDGAGNTTTCTSPVNQVDSDIPEISSVSVSVGETTATITWETNESTYSKINYGLTNSLGKQTSLSGSLLTTNSQLLSSLLSCTNYFYQPIAIDKANNEKLGEIESFTTAGCASNQADTPVLSQSASSVNNDVGGSLALTTTTEQITLDLPANFKNNLGTTNPIIFQIKQLDQEETITNTSVPNSSNDRSNELINSIFDLKAYLNEDERLSEFDEPLLISISYTDAQIEGIDLSTLSIYRYDGSIWERLETTIDRENKKLNAYTSHFSLFAAFGQTEQIVENNSSSSNNSNQTSVSSGPSVCSDSKPLFTSNLFQINITKNTAKIFFSPQADTNKYFISFSSKNSNAEEHGEEVTLLREGVQSHTIYHLDPNSTYYFKVRGQNGCMPGDWSNIVKIKTGKAKDTKTTVFYKSSSIKVIDLIQSVKNVITKNKSKIVSPTIDSKITPEVTKTIETKINNQVQNKESTSQPKTKKCFLWWCW